MTDNGIMALILLCAIPGWIQGLFHCYRIFATLSSHRYLAISGERRDRDKKNRRPWSNLELVSNYVPSFSETTVPEYGSFGRWMAKVFALPGVRTATISDASIAVFAVSMPSVERLAR